MSDNFEIKVEIKEELKKDLVLGLGARLPIAEILRFSGYCDEVPNLIQNLSHGTRAYLVNAGSLSNFLPERDIIGILKGSDKKGKLEHEKRWQELDLEVLNDELSQVHSREQQIAHLKMFYPSLARFILTHFDLKEELE